MVDCTKMAAECTIKPDRSGSTRKGIPIDELSPAKSTAKGNDVEPQAVPPLVLSANTLTAAFDCIMKPVANDEFHGSSDDHSGSRDEAFDCRTPTISINERLLIAPALATKELLL